jgi:DNA-binding GntR family transcriptional regulator
VIASAVGITAASIRAFESEETKRKRAELKKQKEQRCLTERISVYGRTVHRQFPTGDVIVSERDLADQLRKRPDAVITALNLLLNEQKVQKAPLRGYWKLNV